MKASHRQLNNKGKDMNNIIHITPRKVTAELQTKVELENGDEKVLATRIELTHADINMWRERGLEINPVIKPTKEVR